MEALNEALIARALGAKSVKTGKVRADTTVVSANDRYLIHSRVLPDAVRKVGRLVVRIKSAGGARRRRFRDRSRSVTGRVHALGAKVLLRGAQTRQEAQAT